MTATPSKQSKEERDMQRENERRVLELVHDGEVLSEEDARVFAAWCESAQKAAEKSMYNREVSKVLSSLPAPPGGISKKTSAKKTPKKSVSLKLGRGSMSALEAFLSGRGELTREQGHAMNAVLLSLRQKIANA